MTTKDQALKLSLEVLEECRRDPRLKYEHPYYDKTITAIREALTEQPAQGCEFCSHPLYAGTKCKNCGREQPAQQRPQNCGTGYCSCIECLFEPEHQEPVAYAVYHRMGGSKSLHWPEQHSEDGDHNEYQLVPLYTSPPAQQQEPVAWRWKMSLIPDAWQLSDQPHPEAALKEALYPSPPASKPWVGLTEKEKRNVRNSVSYSPLAMTIGEWTEAVQDATEAKLKDKNGY